MNRAQRSATCSAFWLIALLSCSDPAGDDASASGDGGARGALPNGHHDAGPLGSQDGGEHALHDGGTSIDADGAVMPEPVDAGPPLPLELDGLPVLQLWTAPDINGDEYNPARLIAGGHEYAAVQAKHRGKTALRFPKKSFTVKLGKDDLFNDAERGFHDKRRLVLIASFDDNSYLRPRLAFELWNRLQPRVQVQIYNAVLYLDGEYHGLYLVCDHVDDELMEAHALWPGGNLYKARTHDANLRLVDRGGEPKAGLDLGYTKEEGAPAAELPGAFDDLAGLVTWIATAPDAQFSSELDGVLHGADFESWYLLVSTIDAADSAGKNGYLYHDPRPDAPDATWHYVPWDFNSSFGQNWRMVHTAADSPLSRYATKNGLFERYVAIPELAERLEQRFAAALDGAWALPEVLALFDAYAAEISAAARRDEAVWGQNVRDYNWGSKKTEFNSHDEELVYLRAWLEARWAQAHAERP
jgi:spore coat protein H